MGKHEERDVTVGEFIAMLRERYPNERDLVRSFRIVTRCYSESAGRYVRTSKWEGWDFSPVMPASIRDAAAMHEEDTEHAMMDLEDDDGVTIGLCCTECDLLLYAEDFGDTTDFAITYTARDAWDGVTPCEPPGVSP